MKALDIFNHMIKCKCESSNDSIATVNRELPIRI
jgi:hypothetical protein